MSQDIIECWMVIDTTDGRFLWAGVTPESAESYRIGYGVDVTRVVRMREVSECN